ncbi:MAG: UPF0175 family protein [Planktothrix sp.]
MQITLEIPDDISPASLLSEADWLREIAVALFQQELITLGRASKIAPNAPNRISTIDCQSRDLYSLRC